MISSKLLALCIICLIPAVYTRIHCEGTDGYSKDWWVAIKYPDSFNDEFHRFAYIDSKSTEKEFQIIDGLLDDENGVLDKTFATINQMGLEDINVLVFNDEPAESSGVGDPSGTYHAHAKGVLAYDDESRSGLYLLHSAPRFPSVTPQGISYDIPDSALYGQSFMCVEFQNKGTYEALKEQISIIYAQAYFTSGDFDNFDFKVQGDQKVGNINIDGDWPLLMISKSPKYQEYLYDNIMTEQFQQELMVESWGRPYLDPTCNITYDTIDVKTVRLPNGDTWKDTQDHSKWAVTNSADVGCICDINRMHSQLTKGGSCLCLKDTVLGEALSDIIGTTDTC